MRRYSSILMFATGNGMAAQVPFIREILESWSSWAGLMAGCRSFWIKILILPECMNVNLVLDEELRLSKGQLLVTGV
ncbi:predicted protein [Coccidioides posadasii str. Silveira]|uniref:Predicted protein n=1 Tax=Coccidioides posadasii (strain RMSCC 757 / Silveira) TaxID=443226 RepID=E9CZJ0_COCPS|nr:predicted protein [Coccidioides posadasii str. Silveira]